MHFERIIDLIAVNPKMFPYSDKMKEIRRSVISPQTTLYYRFTGEYIELVSSGAINWTLNHSAYSINYIS